MAVYFERDIYKDMVEWKRQRDTNAIPQSLEIIGPNQCGKTTVVKKFAEENYKNVISIDLFMYDNQAITRVWESRLTASTQDGGISDFLRAFSPDFVDSPDTVIVFDEVQESPHIYQLIHRITHELKSHLIILSSYHGEIVLNRDFFITSNDVYSLKMTTLSFEEFLSAFGKRELWESLDLYGSSAKKDYIDIVKLFMIYLDIGGYPMVVSAYMDEGDASKVKFTLCDFVEGYASESRRYLGNNDKYNYYFNYNVLKIVLDGVARLTLNRKYGIFCFIDELVKLVKERYGSIFSRKQIINAVNWLVMSGTLSLCSSVDNCNLMFLCHETKLYFTDLGVARFFLSRVISDSDVLIGFLFENFVFLNLCKMTRKQKLLLEVPTFSVQGNKGINFIVKSRIHNDTYIIKIKRGRNKSKTSNTMFVRGIVNKVLFVNSAIYGGNRDGNMVTIPVYLFSRYDFNEEL
jgi:predicted AAA+ superfamily ATPase